MPKKPSKKLKLQEAGLSQHKSINNLILLAIYLIEADDEKRTFENLVKKCFILFPKVFGFPKYPQWPDSRKLDRPLRELRKRKLITGDPKTFFSLTKAGERTAEEMVKGFGQKRLNL